MVEKITNYKVIEQYLRDYNRSYYLRELAVILKKPHQTIKPYVESLVKEGILIKHERKNIVEYKLNLISKILYDYLVIAEKEVLIERLEKDTLLKILHEKLSKFFSENTFIIFGSAVEELKKGSDIDLLIIGKVNSNSIVKEFEEIYNKKIHKIQVNDLKELNINFIKELYKKHLILNNTEQIIRFFGGLYEQNKLV